MSSGRLVLKTPGGLVVDPAGHSLKIYSGPQGPRGTDLVDPTTLADETWTGPTIRLTAAELLDPGHVGYVNASSKIAKADASVIGTGSAVAMALATIAADASGLFGLPGGFMKSTSLFNFTPGLVFLSTTAGELTQTRPTGTDEVVQVMGVAHNSDTLFWWPQLLQIELA